MNERARLGIALPPDAVFWQHNRALIEEHAELFELTPETLWQVGCAPNPHYERVRQFVQRCGRPAVGHGVLLSIGAASPPPRREAWLAALRRDRAAFDLQWCSEHLGFADADGQHTAWPLPLPPSDEAVAAVAAGLRELRTVHDVVAFENNADLFSFGDPLLQPDFFARICAAADAHLLLDLHNAFAFCRNHTIELDAFLDRLPWERVLEIHLSGGSDSDPGFLPSRRSLRMDSHDGAVPEPVWNAFAAALPRARNLRAVVLEWFPEAMDARAGEVFAADFARARSVLC
jgi:hypothetical protein